MLIIDFLCYFFLFDYVLLLLEILNHPQYIFVMMVIVLAVQVCHNLILFDLFLQALLGEQHLSVCRFSVCLSVCVSEIISRPLIGRKSGTSRDFARRRTT